MFQRANKNKVNSQLINKLGQISKIEYSLIVNYPQLARMIKDKETQEMVNSLGIASIHHFDVVAKALTKLGGSATWSMDLLPDHMDLNQIFQNQLAKEVLALEMHSECAKLAEDWKLKQELTAIANEEKSHVNTVKEILYRLSHSSAEDNMSTPAGANIRFN
jgi:rubrerythrin